MCAEPNLAPPEVKLAFTPPAPKPPPPSCPYCQTIIKRKLPKIYRLCEDCGQTYYVWDHDILLTWIELADANGDLPRKETTERIVEVPGPPVIVCRRVEAVRVRQPLWGRMIKWLRW